MKNIIRLLAAVLLLSACEKQIDIDIEDTESLVVVKASNEAGSPLTVDLTYSRPAFGSFYIYYNEDYFTKITNATVSLTVDGGATMTAARDGGIYTFSHIPQPGEELKLSIAVPGRDEVSATATVPLRPDISNVDTSYSASGYDYYSPMQVNVSFTLNDPSATDDYYAIRLREIDTVIYIERDDDGNITSRDSSIEEYYRFFECTDYLLVNNNGIDIDDPTAARTFSGTEMLFTDATINGMSHDIKLKGLYDRYWDYKDSPKPSDSTAVNYGLYLEVTSLSRDLYLYRQTMNSYSDDELLGFFSEPVQVHSNIEGGIGIFGVCSKVVYRIPLNPANIY